MTIAQQPVCQPLRQRPAPVAWRRGLWRCQLALACLLALWHAGSAQAQAEVQIVATWPEGTEVRLAPNASFYLRLAYRSDAPVQLWAQPYWHGAPAKAGTNPSRVYSGTGEALAWFFLFDPDAQVDEVRISAGDGLPGSTPVAAVWHGLVRTDPGVAAQAQPVWLERLRARERAAQAQAMQERMNRPVTAGERALGLGLMLAMGLLVLLGAGLPAWLVRRWAGGWRLAAAVPLVLMAFVLLRIVLGGMLDPTSHNLWPFELLLAGALSACVTGALALLHRWREGAW